MNSFYHYENIPSGTIHFDVFGKRAKDVKRKESLRMNQDLRLLYMLNNGSPNEAISLLTCFTEVPF